MPPNSNNMIIAENIHFFKEKGRLLRKKIADFA